MSQEKHVIDLNTLIPLGVVISLLALSAAFGATSQKVENIADQQEIFQSEYREDIQNLRDDIKDLSATVNRLLGSDDVAYNP